MTNLSSTPNRHVQIRFQLIPEQESMTVPNLLQFRGNSGSVWNGDAGLVKGWTRCQNLAAWN
jgi:hypothetical protein